MEDDLKIMAPGMTRRDFIKTTAAASLAATLTGSSVLYAAGPQIRVGLIGCGGRGTGAAIDSVEAWPDIVITALGDLFPDMLERSVQHLKEKLPKDNLAVTPETCFTGFDAYKQDLAAGVDLVILGAPPVFRPQHLRAAVEAGKHVFMEKPVAVDPVGVRSVNCEFGSRNAEAPLHRRRHAAPPPGSLPQDHEAHPGGGHR